MKITCTETTTTEYDVTPAEGWTRSDLTIALNTGKAVIRWNAIIGVSDDSKPEPTLATIVESQPKTHTQWQ